MINPKAIFGAEGMINFMSALHAHRHFTPKFQFPDSAPWKEVKLKFKKIEDYDNTEDASPREFFVRLINEAEAAGDSNAIESCQLVEGVAVFMECERSGPRLVRCSVQVIINPVGNLEDLYLDDQQDPIYYRHDYSTRERGSLFDHPFPHIHSVPKGAPRFPLILDSQVFPALAFIEFVMINHSYSNWLEWVIREYGKHYPGDIPDDELTPDQFLDAYKSEANWSRIPEAQRAEFLRRVRRSSRDKLQRLSHGCPSVDPELLALSLNSVSEAT